MPRVPFVTQKAPDHRAILLLDPRLIVLAVGSGTGELDATVGAVLGESLVDEHAVVVRVDAQNGKGQLFGYGLQSCHDLGLLPSQ